MFIAFKIFQKQMKKINLTLLLILGHLLAIYAYPSEEERAVRRAEQTFFRQFAQLKNAENDLLRTYTSYLMYNCINQFRRRSNQQPVVPFTVAPVRDNNIESPHPNPSPRPLGPRDFHIVPPGPTLDFEPGSTPKPFDQPRSLGPRDFHIVPPGPTQDYRQVRPLGPRDFHIVPPGPTLDYRQVRPSGPRDFQVVPPGPTSDPALHRSSFGPRDRHVDPPGPVVDLHLPRPENREHRYNYGTKGEALHGQLQGQKGRQGEPGIPGYAGLPGLPGLSTYDVRDMMIERGRILCDQRHACQL